MIATDHAPHSAEEKAVLPVWKAPSGIIGLETALGLAGDRACEERPPDYHAACGEDVRESGEAVSL